MNILLKKSILFWLNLFYPIFKNILPFQIYAYLAVGAANTLFNIALFFIFHTLVDTSRVAIFGLPLKNLSVEIATIFSFLLSVPTGFWLSKNIAFTEASNEKKETTKQYGKYFLVALQGQFTDYLITKGLILFLNTPPKIAYIFSTIIMLILNFLLQKFFTFKVKK